jgi:hypothetical protein
MNSNYTGRTARNLNQAFGPYCSPYVSPMPEPIHPHDTIVLWGCAVAAVVAFVAVVVL